MIRTERAAGTADQVVAAQLGGTQGDDVDVDFSGGLLERRSTCSEQKGDIFGAFGCFGAMP